MPHHSRFWPPAAFGAVLLAGLLALLARPVDDSTAQKHESLFELLENESNHDSTPTDRSDASNGPKRFEPKVPPTAEALPLAIRVGLVSQRPIKAFRASHRVLCRNHQGLVIPAHQLVASIASSTQQEIHCSGGPVQINRQRYVGDVSLLRHQSDWLAVISLTLETYVASVVGAEMPSRWHREALKAQAVQHAPTPWRISPGRPQRVTTSVIQHAGRCSQARRATTASRAATLETRGMILSYGGGIVESLYASNDQVSAEAHGHLGASMSQTGAQQLASQGLPFNAILGRYYRGASLARLKRYDQ